MIYVQIVLKPIDLIFFFPTKRSGAEQRGEERSREEWSGADQRGAEKSGVERSGVERRGSKRSREETRGDERIREGLRGAERCREDTRGAKRRIGADRRRYKLSRAKPIGERRIGSERSQSQSRIVYFS